MKKILQTAAALLILAVPLAATALAKGPVAGPSGGKKANSIDELAKMYDSSSCKQCHAKIYAEWENSIHARSLVGTMATIGGHQGALKAWSSFANSGMTKPEEVTVDHLMATCAKCHYPHLADATDNVAKELATAFMKADVDTLNKLNINCLVCHSKMAVITHWREGAPQPGEVWGSKEGSHPDKKFTKLKKSETLGSSVFCGQCHQGPIIDSPATIQCSTLFGSYLNAYIPMGGDKSCQECHVKNGDGHAMLSHWDRDYTKPENVKRALDVQLAVSRPYTSLKDLPDGGQPYSTLTVNITNNAGHRIPDG